MGFLAEALKICVFSIVLFALVLFSAVGGMALLSNGPALLLVALGFGFLPKAILALCLVAFAVLLVVFALAMMLRIARSYLGEGVAQGRLSRAVVCAGCALAVLIVCVICVVLPQEARNALIETATGERRPDRQSLPGTEEDRRWIEGEIRPQAQSGNARAQFALGTLYLVGSHGVETDADEGMSWIAKSAAQGNFDALLSQALRKRYPAAPDYGHTVSKEEIDYRARNVAALIDAAPPDRQAAVAMLVALILRYSYDGGTPEDAPMRQWLSRAAQLGSGAAAAELGGIVERSINSPVELDTARAYALYAWAGASFDADRTWRRMDGEARQRAAALLETALRDYRDPHRPADRAVLDDVLLRVKLIGARGGDDGWVHALAASERSAFAFTPARLGYDESAGLARGPARRWLQEQRARSGDCQARLALADLIHHSNYNGGWAQDQTDLAWAAANYRLAARCAKDEDSRRRAEYGEKMLRSLMLGPNRDAFDRSVSEIEARLSAAEQSK